MSRVVARLSALAWPFALLPLVGGCDGAAAELHIAVAPAEGADLSDVVALKILVRDLSAEGPETFGPFALDTDRPTTLSSTVPPERPLYVDVWGCPSEDRCSPVDVVARGCTPVLELAEGEVREETVIVDDVTANPPCPPTVPDDS